jgi:hypothetical protein
LIIRNIFEEQYKSLTFPLRNLPVPVISSLWRPNISLSTHFSSWAHSYFMLHIFWGVTFWWLVNNYRHLGYDRCFCRQGGSDV